MSVTLIVECLESGKRGKYSILTPAQRYKVGRRAAEHGVTANLCYYLRRFPELSLKETTARRLQNEYRASLKKPGGSSSGVEEIKELRCKKLESHYCLVRNWISKSESM